MNQREKILGGFVLVILLGFGAKSIHTRLTAAYDRYASQEEALSRTHFDEQLKLKTAEMAAERIAQWREKALPSNSTQAKLAYEFWITDQMSEAGLKSAEISKTNWEVVRNGFRLLKCDIEGEGSLKAITDFLFRFYRANHLHKISELTLATDNMGRTFKMSGKVDAWSMNDADRVDKLAEGESNRLAHDAPDVYRDTIDSRNIFAVYEAPSLEQPREERRQEAPPPFDHVKHAVVNAIVGSGQKTQAWINVWTTGEKHHLYEGQDFKIGDFQGKIVEIDARSIIYESDGKRYTVRIGNNLREGQVVEEEQGG